MKNLMLAVFVGIPLIFIGQTIKNSSVSKNMQEIKWGTESHVILCSSFGITQPLGDIIRDRSTVKSKPKKTKQAPDKRDMPVQNFVYNAKEHGEKYGNDNSIIQREYGLNIGYENNKTIEQNWEGQAPNVSFRLYDPTGAVGPNHYIQMINGDTYEIWDKTGNSLGGGNISALWSPAKGDGDPIVLYDKAADRWFMSQFGGSGDNGIYIAISQTADPLGVWYTYEFLSPDFPDYLKFSAWQDGYYMTANYAEKIFAFNRNKMLAGDASAEAVYQTFNPPASGFFVPLPADASDGIMPGANTPCPIFSYADDAWGSSAIDAVNIYNASVTWTGTPNMNVTTAANLNTAAFDASYDNNWDDISQPGVSQKLDGIGGAMMFRAQWKTWSGYNTVILNWAVQVSPSQRGIFWCELRQDQTTDSWSIYQQGIYAPGSDSYWMGSIAMNDNGDIGLAYAKGSSSTYMTLAYTGRLASDPLGTMPIAEVIAKAGTGSQTGVNRVGDYAQTCLDPDGQTFWHTGEYLGNGGTAKTHIYSFKFADPCTTPTNQASNYSANAIEDNQMTVNWTRGNGNRVIVLANEGSIVNTNPGNGVNYTSNSAFGSGDQIGVSNYVIYDGTGNYTVVLTATNSSGPDDETKINYITVIAAPDAGINGTLTACEGTAPSHAQLFAELGGSPDEGGLWTNIGLVYTYTVNATAPCTENATATVSLTEQLAPDAGINGTLTVCEGTTPSNAQLFSELGGSPDEGGLWTNIGLVYTYTVNATPPCTENASATITLSEQAAPNAGTNGSLTICNDTSPSDAQLFPELGGTPDNNGSWTNIGLVYTYTVNATAPCTENATAIVTVTITEQAAPNAGTNGSLTICNDTSPSDAQLFPELGGTPDNNGSWTNIGLVYTYTVNATAPCTENATAIVTVTITEQAAPNAGTNGFLNICEGTTPTDAELFAELGGSPDNGGSWTNTNLVYTYTVIATAPCTGNATATVTLTEQAAPNAGTNATLNICEGATPTDAELFAELGGSPDNGGSWTNTNSVYTYTVIAIAPCTENATAIVTVTLSPLPQVSFDIDASGEPIINFTNTSTDALSYSWDLGDGTTEATTDVSHEYTSNNTFTVILSATNPCGTVTNQQNVTITSIGITSLKNSSIKIFPNPTEKTLNIVLPIKNTKIQLISMDGKVLRNIIAGESQNIFIDVENISPGVYNLIITTEDKEQVIVKVVKN